MTITHSLEKTVGIMANGVVDEDQYVVYGWGLSRRVANAARESDCLVVRTVVDTHEGYVQVGLTN
jgi:hypothetical protein